MPRWRGCIPVFTLWGAAALGQPVVSAIENNYSYVRPGLPNYGIAQGSIFVIFGANLSLTSSALQGVPLKTAISGVSVQFNVQGAATQALLYYVQPAQIVGVLPSGTPIGTGTVVVSSAGQSSAPAPVTVLQSAVGINIATSDGSGGGLAAAFDANWNMLSSTNAANPGDVIVLYGTGAGPVSGDESIQQIPLNLSGVPLEVDIGGVPAAVTYHGRSIYPGLDQFNVVVPAGAVGCGISLVARSGDIVSNFAMLPVAVGSRVCSDPAPGTLEGPVKTLTGKTTYSLGTLKLLSTSPVSPGWAATAGGIFQSLTGFLPSEPLQLPSGNAVSSNTLIYPAVGDCAVSTFLTSAPNQGQGTAMASAATPGYLNAGPALHFTGPNGEASAPYDGVYSESLAGSPMAPPLIPSAGGLFTIDNGGGGTDVGPFSTQINIPPPLMWTNAVSSVIDRSQGWTITWTGGNPAGVVFIQGNSAAPDSVQPAFLFAVQFTCTASVSAHQFTIPASVLLALPPHPISTSTLPILSIASESNFLFAAPGLDGGVISAGFSGSTMVTYR